MKKRDVNDGTIGVGLTEKQKSEAKKALTKAKESQLNKPVFLKQGESPSYEELKANQIKARKTRAKKDLKRKQKTKKWQREQIRKRNGLR